MFRRSRRGSWRAYFAVLILAGTGIAVPAKAQGFETAVQSRARVFPEINSGVTAMKRDGAGRYYILATPPTVIWVYSPQGKRIGQIPRADSETAKIQYAVDFDLDPDGRIFVADRAANAVEIFSADGSLISKIPVFAPTGVVALPDKQFAVSTLRSKRLVEIRDDRGALVRSFGDPAELGLDPDSKKLQNVGKVSGDGAGDIYFAFTSLPDPTVRKYDRYGYAASEVTFAASRYEPSLAPSADDRVQFGVNFSDTNFSDSYNTWATIGNKGDVLFGGGLSPGLGAHLGSQPGTAQSATEGILSTGLAKGPGGGGPGGAAGGGMVSAQGSYQGNSLQLHVGGKSSRAGGAGTSGGSSGSTGSGEDAILQFSPQDLSSNDSLGTGSSDDDTQALLFSQFSDQGLSAGAGAPGYGPGARGGGGGTFAGIGLFPGLGSFGRFGGTNVAGGIGGGFALRGARFQLVKQRRDLRQRIPHVPLTYPVIIVPLHQVEMDVVLVIPVRARPQHRRKPRAHRVQHALAQVPRHVAIGQ